MYPPPGKIFKAREEGPVGLSKVAEPTGTKRPGYVRKGHCFSREISIAKAETSPWNAHVTLSVENITPLSKFNTNLKIDTLKKEVNPEIQSMGVLGRD